MNEQALRANERANNLVRYTSIPQSFFRPVLCHSTHCVGVGGDGFRFRGRFLAFFLVKGVDVSLNFLVVFGQHLLAEDAFDERILGLIAKPHLPLLQVQELLPVDRLRHRESLYGRFFKDGGKSQRIFKVVLF